MKREAGQESVPAAIQLWQQGIIMGIYKRQFRVTCSLTASPHMRMTMKPEVKSCWRNLSSTDRLLQREVSVHSKTRQQKNCRSQFSACVANSAAVTEFLCYITHLLSKSPENTRHWCPLVLILKPGINQSALCSVCRKCLFLVLSSKYVLFRSAWHMRRPWHNVSVTTSHTTGSHNSCNFEWYLNTTSATLCKECECTRKHHELYIKTA